jgi:tRNA pseudouridine13 synthase
MERSELALGPEFPYVHPDLPPMGGAIKEASDDFVVEEVPLFALSGEGEHLYVSVTKRGVSTLDAIKQLARAIGVTPAKFGYAGLKDRHAVATQVLSIQLREDLPRAAYELPGLTINWATRHRHKLRAAQLRGNKFRLVVRGVQVRDRAALAQLFARIERDGFANYFGPQRFGNKLDGHITGKALLTHTTEERIPRPMRRLFLSAYQSHLFNLALARRIGQGGFGALWQGDVAMKHANGACFRVADAAAEQPRMTCFEISPTGPIFGTKMLAAEGPEGALEGEILGAERLAPDAFANVAPGLALDGARRSYRMRPEELAWELDGEALKLEFFLPKGVYATTFLRELVKPEEKG